MSKTCILEDQELSAFTVNRGSAFRTKPKPQAADAPERMELSGVAEWG